MSRVDQEVGIETVADVLRYSGVPEGSARIVADELVQAEQMGLRSHGLMRVLQYRQAAKDGDLDVNGTVRVVRETTASVVIDGGRNFGLIGGLTLVDQVARRAGAVGTASGILRNAHHVGRLGALTQSAAERGLVAWACATVRLRGHFVAPVGGRDGRLGTNPLSYAFPAAGGPIVSDFATSVVPEGTVKLALQTGAQVAEGAMIDATGNPTTAPAAFYGPPQGALLPFGGPAAHKGYALALLAELAAGSLVGDLADDPQRAANSVLLVCFDPAFFELSPGGYESAVNHLAEYVTSSRPVDPRRPVLLPGEREAAAMRSSAGVIVVPREVWEPIATLAADLRQQQLEGHDLLGEPEMA